MSIDPPKSVRSTRAAEDRGKNSINGHSMRCLLKQEDGAVLFTKDNCPVNIHELKTSLFFFFYISNVIKTLYLFKSLTEVTSLKVSLRELICD